MNKTTRRYDIEWLRTIGVLLVMPFHSLLIFNTNPESIMYIKDNVNVRLFNILDSVINRFHMSLLFVIAGMSVYFSLQSRTANKFINQRVRKLLIPAVFGCIALNPIMTYIYLISTNKNGTFLEHFIDFFTKNPGDFTGVNGAFTPAHLWFIIFLFVFSLVGVPLFMSIIKGNCNNLLSNLASFFEKPLMLILTVIPITIISAVNILGDKNPLVYFAIFFIGFLLVTDERYLKAINRDKWAYLIVSIIIIYMKFTLPDKFEPWSAIWIIYGFFDRATRFIPVFAIIGLANEFMTKNTEVLNYLSKASFPVYVLHMLFNTIVGFFVIKLSISPELKYIVIVTVTFAICFLLYEVIRRIKFLHFIFGIKVGQKISEGINCKEYKTKSFSSKIFSGYSFKSEFKEISNKKEFLKSSSSITAKLIYSGELKTHLSTAINLNHPSCSGLKDKEVSVPIFAYLIHHEKFGYFLIDSGCDSSYINNPYGQMKVSLISKFVPKTILRPEDAIDKQIENCRNDIKGVFFTHLHLDHTSGLSALPDNLLYFSGKGEKPLSIKWLLEPNDFKNNDTMYILNFDSTQAQSTPLGKAIDIFGDQSFWAISTPGHTKGHTSYLVNTKEHPILIAGDACCISLSIEKGVGPSGSDTTLGQKSFERIMQFLKDNPEVKVWIGHEFPK